jgi:hypothetical protein
MQGTSGQALEEDAATVYRRTRSNRLPSSYLGAAREYDALPLRGQLLGRGKPHTGVGARNEDGTLLLRRRRRGGGGGGIGRGGEALLPGAYSRPILSST